MLKQALIGTASALLVALLIVRLAPGSSPAVTTAQVQAMQAQIPNCENGCESRGGFAHVNDARAVAAAISRVARSREDACNLALFAAWESANTLQAEGDKDAAGAARAFGPWQLHGVPREVAFDPVRAGRVWLGFADASRAACSALPPEERLASLMSGSCDRGREKARHRDEVVQEICR